MLFAIFSHGARGIVNYPPAKVSGLVTIQRRKRLLPAASAGGFSPLNDFMKKRKLLAIILAIISGLCITTGCGDKKQSSPKIHKSIKAVNITKKWLTAGNYVVGYNLPEGIYIISNGENSGSVTIYRKNCPAETFYINNKKHYARTLQDGDAITVHGNTNVLLSCDQSSNAFAKSQVKDANKSGIIETDDSNYSDNAGSSVNVSKSCTVGDTTSEDSDNIPKPGWYNIKVSGKGHIKISGDAGFTIDEDMSDDGTGGPSDYQNVFLKNGEKIEIINYNPKDDETGSQDETSFQFDPLQAKSSDYQSQDSYNTRQQTKENKLLDGSALSEQ